MNRKEFIQSTGMIPLILLSILFLSACQQEPPEEKATPFLLGQGIGINKATLLVNDLDSAMNYFKDSLGFNVRGKAKKGVFEGTLSTSIALGDLSFIELFSADDSVDQSLVPAFISEYLSKGEGVRLYALSSSSVDSTYTGLNSVGFVMDSTRSYRSSSDAPKGWSRDDGGVQRKSLDFDSTNPPAYFPRFVESIGYDYAETNRKWNTYYIYRRKYNKQPNGTVGIAAIRVAVKELEQMAQEYRKMGFEEIKKNDTEVAFRIYRNQELHLVQSAEEQGVFALRFHVENLDSTEQFFEKEQLPLKKTANRLTIAPAHAFGVQLEFVQEPEEQAVLVRKLTPKETLDTLAVQNAVALYTKYCALCHGENREGYAADNAPSLRSHSLLASSKNNNFMRYAIQFGRGHSAMAGYLDTQGGPLEYIEIELILEWLYQEAGVKEAVKLSKEPVVGDLEVGAKIYAQNCASCHGEKGEGISAPALANPMLLATASDHFLRYAISEGRDGTPMQAYKEQLSAEEIDAVTAFLRSRASGWDVPKPVVVSVPSPEDYVLNPAGEAPDFKLREGKFTSAEQVNRAVEEKNKMIILDARSKAAWQQMHIPGAIPVPFYEEPENFINDIPNDDTQIVIYCACPHAASLTVMNTLKRNGFKNPMTVIDEGILVWANEGYPVQSGALGSE